MAYIRINHKAVNSENAQQLVQLCPFSAISYESERLDIGMACKMCKLCLKNGPPGLLELVEDVRPEIDKAAWRGVAVYAEVREGGLHKVVYELIGKALELARVAGEPVYALLCGADIAEQAEQLLYYGVDRVFVCDDSRLRDFRSDIYANVFAAFINRVNPSVVMVGATNIGRTLAPQVAARFRSGLTADCTMLEMGETRDLVQIRPAFGGNIMAQIITPRHRPQFCTVRYKIFPAAAKKDRRKGEIVVLALPSDSLDSRIEVLSQTAKPREVDISEAEIIVAVGRGIKSKESLRLAEELAALLGGVTACTRPLVEAGWFDAKRQIGLSGRTVKAKLIITLGISGFVQFTAGMRGCDCIIAVNTDKNAAIFDVAHFGLVGDLYEITSGLIAKLKGM